MKLNAHAQVSVVQVGRVPILMIDNFYADPEQVRAQALLKNYDLSIAQYPGRHAPISASDDDYKSLVQVLIRLMRRISDHHFLADEVVSDFSIITTQPDQLLAIQKHPHIDPGPVLGIVYLTPGSTEGTAFFFNRQLGTEVVVTPDQHAAYLKFITENAEQLAPLGYSLDEHPVWEKLYTIEPVFNRFVLYPGNVFHSVDVKSVSKKIDLNTVRLTQRFLINSLVNNPVA